MYTGDKNQLSCERILVIIRVNKIINTCKEKKILHSN